MVHSRSLVCILHKDGLVSLRLNFQSKFNNATSNFNDKLTEIKKCDAKIETDSNN